MDPQYTPHGIGYLTPTMFSFSRAIDRERLAHLPGATLVNNSVNFLHADSAQPGLAAARLLKRDDKSKTSSPAAAASAGRRPGRTGSGTTSAIPGWTGETLRGLMELNGTEWPVFHADAAQLRRQRQSPPHLRPHCGGSGVPQPATAARLPGYARFRGGLTNPNVRICDVRALIVS